MAKIVTFHIHRAWWVMPYVHTLDFLCTVTGAELNMGRLRYWLSKGVTVRYKEVV